MAVTIIKRKLAKNKLVAKQRKQGIKANTEITYIKSPYKGESGIVIEDQK